MPETHLPQIWRLRDQRYRLEGAQCAACGEKIFPAKEICPNCKGDQFTPYVFSGRGEIYSYSVMYQAPHGFDKDLPYTVALVKLAEGPIITAQLTDIDPGEAEIGQLVEMVTRVLGEEGELGAIEYGYKFRPLLQS
ncbi:MAG: Zn-ribbon domain-containing OB-fold protein [Chloroflexi bacterium]|nr:Zn-ribbon domain-containing OB-fold protein [Chloroflexota bacterium]